MTTRDIAAAAGVSERTVYRHVPDRDALLEGLSQRLSDLDGVKPSFGLRGQLRIAAVIRCLVSSRAWLRMREEFGVPGIESGPVVAWVIDIISELRAGNIPTGR